VAVQLVLVLLQRLTNNLNNLDNTSLIKSPELSGDFDCRKKGLIDKAVMFMAE